MMKIAVTSASGQLGGAIIRALLKELSPNQIIGIARTPAKARHLGVEIRKGDYNHKEEFEQALQEVDGVLLLSANGDPQKRIPQHRNVIEAAKGAGVKKIVYTSIAGKFGLVVDSNMQTEADIRNSGMEWTIGRNGIYIEPDVEYIDNYKKAGKIANSAANGKCSYTTRDELAYAYARMLLENKHNGKTYYLAGEPITQYQLADYLNLAFGTNIRYEPMTVEEYFAERKAALGEFLGTIIGGIYESIRKGDSEVTSDYESAAGRPHISWQAYFSQLS